MLAGLAERVERRGGKRGKKGRRTAQQLVSSL